MSVDLILDCREHKLIEMFPDTETKQLDIGDILYVNSENHSEIKCIVERKTLNDLSSSIIDGRYKEQKCRLLSSGIRVVYIQFTLLSYPTLNYNFSFFSSSIITNFNKSLYFNF